MSLRRLKTLIAVAEKGTFGGAADSVLISHAAVSQQMKILEEDLQVTLFDRTKRSPKLNRLGQALVTRAREIVHAYDNMVESIVSEGALMGELTIGAVPTTMTGLVPKAVGVLKALYPNLHVRIVPGLSADLLPQVDRGVLDAAIISEPPYIVYHLTWRPFAEEPLIVLASLQEPSDDPEYLIETFPYIRFSRRAWTGRLIDEWMQERKLKVEESMELDTLEAISTMVFNNLGVSIVPLRCVPSPHPLPLKRILIGPSAKPRVLGLVSRNDSVKFQLIDAFLVELVRLVEKAGKVKAIGRSADLTSSV